MTLQPYIVRIVFIFSFGWIAFLLVGSILVRSFSGMPIFRPRFAQALFLETWRSGRSLRTWISRMGGAKNCLWVVVDKESLQIAPHFPFHLAFVGTFYGLELSVPAGAIHAVKRQQGFLKGSWVRIIFERSPSSAEEFEISLKDPQAFIDAITTIQGMA
jgi:hypothetical protein